MSLYAAVSVCARRALCLFACGASAPARADAHQPFPPPLADPFRIFPTFPAEFFFVVCGRLRWSSTVRYRSRFPALFCSNYWFYFIYFILGYFCNRFPLFPENSSLSFADVCVDLRMNLWRFVIGRFPALFCSNYWLYRFYFIFYFILFILSWVIFAIVFHIACHVLIVECFSII